jgi:riboflavin kinase/FMN adenylyltransferase
MIVVTSPEELAETLTESCVTIGNFDGVHKGHQKLIATTVQQAAAAHMLSVVVTFDPHPSRVLSDKKTPPFITLTEQKLELIAALGPAVALVIPFTRELAALEPEDFVQRYLVEGLHMRQLVIGYDYAFGRHRKGNYEILRRLGERYGYSVERLDPVIIEGAVVSSTRIRDLVQAGNVYDARPLLGRFYQVKGTVIHGHNRGGRLLGFPTANLELVDELFPKPGVYAVWAEVLGLSAGPMPAVANIGYNPTFGDDRLSVEVFILDFDGDLYGRQLRVHFVQRIRSEQKFSGVAELVARIGEDVGIGRRILASPEAAISAKTA